MQLNIDTSETRMTLRKLWRRPKYRHMLANRLVPHVPWLILFAYSVVFYKARIFADSGFYVAQFINNKFFWIECQRIVLAISQLLPLIGVWAGIEIRYVLLLYSVSHVLFFYVLFIFVYYGLRDRRSGLLIILFQTVGIMHSFFTPMFELYYGVPLLVTFYAIWRLPYRSRNTLFMLLMLEVLILLSHPLAFMLFPFLLIYEYKRQTTKPRSYYLALMAVFLLAIVFKAFFMCEYETGKMSWQFGYAGNKLYMQFLSPSYYSVLAQYMLTYYAEVLLAFILLIAMLAYNRQWYKLVVVTGTFLAYMFLVNSAYTVSHSRYMEQVMFPFVPIVFIPLVYGFPENGQRGFLNLSILAVSGLIAYRLMVIYNGSEIFMQRVRQMEQLIDAARQKGGSKFVVSKNAIDHGYTQCNWSYPIETLLLSAIDGNDIALTIAPDEDLNFENNQGKIKASQFLFRKWEIKDHSWLNKQYFHLDIGGYRLLNDTLPNAAMQPAAENFRIEIKSRNFYRSYDTVWIPVRIINQTKSTIYSGAKNKVQISYFWIKNSNVLNWQEIRTPLQADLSGELQQDVLIAIPADKGWLKLKVDLLANDRWTGVNCVREILVY